MTTPALRSERAPYCSIQTAIDNAVDTDEIVVAPGAYVETINFLGKAITVRSSDGPEVTIIVDGKDLFESIVSCVSGEGSDTVLDGFTITRGPAIVLWLDQKNVVLNLTIDLRISSDDVGERCLLQFFELFS